MLDLQGLIGEPGEDVVLEGEQIGQFADLYDHLRTVHGCDVNDTVEARHIRRARRIVGRDYETAPIDPHGGEVIGSAMGREWSYEF